ncbi:MAG: F0F1 ATP synthase subunit B [Cyclobacteriaceae bacterium]|nr:F0F1 ATP synthase subunit B [Cyclobacteriaceae bacterium]
MDLVTPGIGLIFWQTVTFLAVILILGKFVWRPIMNALKAREGSIEEALRAAELAREEMEKLHADNEKLMAEARVERDQVIKDASVLASKMREEAREEANKITQKMIDDARHTIQLEKQAAINEIRNQVAEFSLQISEKILRRNLENESQQKALIEEYLKDMKLN